MKKLLIILGLLLVSQTVFAEIPDNPDVTLLSNDPGELLMYNNYLIGKNNRGLAAYQLNSNDSLYHLENFFYKDINSEEIKINDSLLIYKANSDQLHFVNLSSLPQFEYLGFIDFNEAFADFIIKDDKLYLSKYYNGVHRYQMNSFSSAEFLDSSMIGIMTTQLVEQNDTLYVLDEYNGLLRYDISGSGFGQFIDYMYVPHRVKSYIKDDLSYYLNLNDSILFKGEFNIPGEVLIDSVEYSSEINKVEHYNDLLFLYSSRSVALLNRNTFNFEANLNIEDYKPTGIASTRYGKDVLLLPANSGGVKALPLDGASNSDQILYYGNFSDFSTFRNSLFVSALNEPVAVYDINDQLDVFENYKIYEQFDNSYKLTSNGDSLFVIYPDLNETAIIYASSDPEGYLWENSYVPQNKEHYGIHFIPVLTHGENMLLYDLLKGYDVYSVSANGQISYRGEWPTVNNKSSFSVLGDMVVNSDGVSSLRFYDLWENFGKIYTYSLDLGTRIFETIKHENYLYAFSASKMYQIELAPDTPYTVTSQINLPYGIVDSDIENNQLVGVGPDGLVQIDMSNQTPELIAWGGQGGSRVELSNGIAVVSNGFDLTLYYLNHITDVNNDPDITLLPDKIELAQNYPNPFNLETAISFSLPRGEEVKLEIYNILGQKVRQLVDEKLSAGQHTYFWDGKNETGGVVATGLYLYRLNVGENNLTKKMMLLK